MARKEKTIHYIYKTTCNVTNRYYIGMHSTNNIDDGYMGSGKRLRYSISKHGVDNHTKEILEYCNTREELKIREEQIINSDLVNENNCMNLVIGGGGFMLDEYHYKCSKIGGKVHAERIKNDKTYREEHSKRMSDTIKKSHAKGKLTAYDWTGREHTEETKLKMSEVKKGQGSGKTNSQYGTCWITNGKEVKKIKKEYLDLYVKDGWNKGRKL